MPTTVFFSWQSTRPGRNFIDKALQEAINRISDGMNLEEAEREERIELDRDTKNVGGSPAIFDTILKKILNAAIFVSDLTFVGTSVKDKPLSNPNVLIEHGFALKALGDVRMMSVMNIAHGPLDALPFDLRAKRFPVVYDLPDDADDQTRRKVRNDLSKDLEYRIREILQDPDYIASQPQPPAPPARTYREPLEGRARFRAEGEPIGTASTPMAAFMGGDSSPVHLSSNPAMWLRVAPVTPIEKPMKITDVLNRVNGIITLPFLEGATGNVSVRDADGAGFCKLLEPGKDSDFLAFLFTDGEIWSIDAWHLNYDKKQIILDEKKFVNSLKQCADFLTQLQIPSPYRWVAGLEDTKGRYITPPDSMQRKFGPCGAPFIEEDGTYTTGEDPALALEPFFDRLYDQCGLQRPKTIKR